MGDNLAEFRVRGASLFRSLRPKKTKSSKKSKSGGSTSMFSSLLLANYEHQMQFDPNVNFSNDFTFEKSQMMIRDMKNPGTNSKIIEVNDEVKEEDEESSDSEDVNEVLHDIKVFEIYENILFVILHRVTSEPDQDIPTVNEQSAINYVRDAFGISENKHNEIFERIKLRKEIKDDSVDHHVVSTKKSKAMEAHTCLIKILLNHELELSQTPRFYWSGKFSFLASSILSLHSEWIELNDIELLLSKWSAFVDVHLHHPLDLKVFTDILKLMVEEINSGKGDRRNSLTIFFIPSCFHAPSEINDRAELEHKGRQLKAQDDDVLNVFWRSVGILNDSFLRFISNLTEENDLEYLKVMILQKVCKIIKTLKEIEKSRMNLNFDELIKSSILKGTSKHISRTLNKVVLKSTDSIVRMDEMIKVLEIAIEDYNLASERFSPVFKENLNLDYSSCLYKSVDSKLSALFKPIVIDISNSEKLNIDNFYEPGDHHRIVRKFFQLYLKFKSFADIGLEFSDEDLQTADYFKWFLGGINKWNENTVFSVFSRMQRSILLDNLKPSNKNLKHSKSASDCLSILKSTRKFWEEFSQDAIEDENIDYLALADVCRFSNIYCSSIAEQVEKCHAMVNYGIFKVPLEICVGVSNISFVTKETQILCNELRQKAVQNYPQLWRISESNLESGKKRKSKLLQTAILKMKTTIRKLLLEGADIVKKGSLMGERLIVYIEDSLLSLQEDLIPSDFMESKTILLISLMEVFDELIEKSLQIQRTPAFFTNLRTIFHSLQELFLDETNKLPVEIIGNKLTKLDSLLERHELNSSKLIHQYYKERYQMQEAISRSPFNPCGVLSITAFFINNVLKLKILNAKNLIPLGVNRKCDSFVKINIIPENFFPDCQSFKTKVEMDTHFPLYDELFEFELTKEQRSMKDAIIFFNIKDKVLFTRNHCIAEAFLSFQDIPEFSKEREFMKQIHLTLTRLQSDDMDSLKALQQRSESDKAARDFLAKIKFKIPELPPKSAVTNL